MDISVKNNGCFFNFSFPRGGGKTEFEKNVDKIFAEQPAIGGLTIDEIVFDELQKLLFVEPEPISYTRKYDYIREAIFPPAPSFIYSTHAKAILNKSL